MSIRRSAFASLATLALATMVACSGASAAALGRSSADGNCKVVAKGSPWADKGKKGTTYTISGNRSSACALGAKWLVRLTNMSSVPKNPPGWECIAAVAVVGQCENKSGAIFEWVNKPK